MTEKNEYEKMIDEEYYTADKNLIEMEESCEKGLLYINSMAITDNERAVFLNNFFGSCGEDLRVNYGFGCRYGKNIFLGKNCRIDFNVSILDTNRVIIGDDVIIGPNTVITAEECHMNAALRAKGTKLSHPVTIGDRVFLGANVVIKPGVSLGNNAVIEAGAVVESDIPENALAAGVPAKVIRIINQNEEIDELNNISRFAIEVSTAEASINRAYEINDIFDEYWHKVKEELEEIKEATVPEVLLSEGCEDLFFEELMYSVQRALSDLMKYDKCLEFLTICLDKFVINDFLLEFKIARGEALNRLKCYDECDEFFEVLIEENQSNSNLISKYIGMVYDRGEKDKARLVLDKHIGRFGEKNIDMQYIAKWINQDNSNE